MSQNTSIRNQERRLRRRATNMGLMLQKSRRRSTTTLDYGSWYVIDQGTNALIVECRDLGEVEEVLSRREGSAQGD